MNTQVPRQVRLIVACCYNLFLVTKPLDRKKHISFALLFWKINKAISNSGGKGKMEKQLKQHHRSTFQTTWLAKFFVLRDSLTICVLCDSFDCLCICTHPNYRSSGEFCLTFLQYASFLSSFITLFSVFTHVVMW